MIAGVREFLAIRGYIGEENELICLTRGQKINDQSVYLSILVSKLLADNRQLGDITTYCDQFYCQASPGDYVNPQI